MIGGARPRRRLAGRPRAALALTVGVALSMLLAACTEAAPAGQQVAGVRTGAVVDVADREAAPLDVTGPVLGGDGEQLALSAYAGDVVVLNFWASWCPPCRVEQPELNQAAELLADEGVAFVGIDVDEDSEANGLAHVREFDVPYPSIHDPRGEVASRFGGIGAATLPSTLVLDPEGRVAVRILGETDALEVVAAVTHVLGSAAADTSSGSA